MHYIQRCSPRIDTSRKGIDALLSFDYMGSAEFEFGALGESAKWMRDNSKDLVILGMPELKDRILAVKANPPKYMEPEVVSNLIPDDGMLYFLCHKNNEEEVRHLITRLLEGGLSLKESVTWSGLLDDRKYQSHFRRDQIILDIRHNYFMSPYLSFLTEICLELQHVAPVEPSVYNQSEFRIGDKILGQLHTGRELEEFLIAGLPQDESIVRVKRHKKDSPINLKMTSIWKKL